MAQWQKISGKTVYRNKFYVVEEDTVVRPDGNSGIYSVVRKGPFCIIIALDDKQQPYFIKQFRYPTQQEGWELIKGGCDGEEPLLAARRELQEEAGLRAGQWAELGRVEGASSYCDEIAHIFVATKLEYIGSHAQQEEGITECMSLSKAKYQRMIKSGELHDSHTLAALYIAQLHGVIQ